MNKPSIPQYKPPKELQDILDQQATLRKRTAQLPKRSWVYRNPRLFQITFITTSLLVFFSHPIYDAFFAPSYPPLDEALKFEKSK